MVTLQTVEIPGYREALQRESRVRDTAFLDGLEVVCGVEVYPLSLRRIVWLEQAQNGFIVPWIFDSDSELLAHALQILYFSTPEYRPPTSPKFGFWRAFGEGYRQHRFFGKLKRDKKAEDIIKEIQEWVADAFMDRPNGGGSSEVAGPSYAGYPAYIVDKLGAAGLPFAYDEIMDMPLRRLWQHWRIAVRRIDEATLTNPSDEVATNYIAGVKP